MQGIQESCDNSDPIAQTKCAERLSALSIRKMMATTPDTSPAKALKIDFVSDVACPWCAVGLGALEQAIQNLKGEVATQIHFQPFQLNPDMPPEGQDITEHLTQKYGSSAAQQAKTYDMIRERGAEVGFDFRLGGRGRTWNTFDCHRLLHWGGELDEAAQAAGGALAQPTIQAQLKKEMLKAYFTEGQNPAARDVLLAIVARLGLDGTRAAAILDSDEYTAQVRARQRFYASHEIHAVPAVIINDRHLISGGQPAEVFEQALRKIAQQSAEAVS
jgi:predicted DsbA family dithiol-disulfide isomerase